MEKLNGNAFNSDNIPIVEESIYPKLYTRDGSLGDTYHYTYTDNFGDTIIEDIL